MGPVAAGIGLVVILLANLTTNVAANLVSPSYDFSQLAPDKISFRMGGLIAAGIGLLFMPWKLLATSGGYLFTWLGGYGTLLGRDRRHPARRLLPDPQERTQGRRALQAGRRVRLQQWLELEGGDLPL